MSDTQEYSIQCLTEIKDGKVTGAMSPVLSAQALVKERLIPALHGLYRVYSEPSVNQKMEKGEGLTGYDTLVAVAQYKNTKVLALFIDMGMNQLPAALWMSKYPIDDVVFTPVYDNYE